MVGLVVCIIGLGSAGVVLRMCFTCRWTGGDSMLPTLQTGDLVLINKASPRWRPARSGEVVLVRYARKEIIKRVGRTTSPWSGRSGFARSLSPVSSRVSGKVWLLGDNPRASADSRTFGWVPMSVVYGYVVAIVWPSRRWRRLVPRSDMPGGISPMTHAQRWKECDLPLSRVGLRPGDAGAQCRRGHQHSGQAAKEL